MPEEVSLRMLIHVTLSHPPALKVGSVGEHGLIMPAPLPPSAERFQRYGLYLIEDGQTMFLWVGRDAVPQLISDVFNMPNYEALRGGKVSIYRIL